MILAPALQEDPGLPPELRRKVEVATRRAVRWLLHEQQQDGSWRSPQYGVLRGGQAYTPFVLHTLMTLPPRVSSLEKSSIDSAIAFIKSQMSEDGALGYQDKDVLEYPVYATSYAIRALRIMDPEDPEMKRMAAWLAGMQLAEAKGFKPESPAYGGWGFGVRTLGLGDPGHMDLAHTRRALEALRDAGALDRGTKQRAERFLGLVQKLPGESERFSGVPGFERVANRIPHDGGFFFSPVVLVANKALWERPGQNHDAYFRSYSTATADGLLARHALRPPEDPKHEGPLVLDPSEAAAAKWLEEHWQVDVAGIPSSAPEPWGAALRYYNLAVMCEAATALRWPRSRFVPFGERLLSLQLPDGSFMNLDSVLMKEDDPILATTLAVIALARVAGIKTIEPLPPAAEQPERTPLVIQSFRQDLAWSPDGRHLAYSELTRMSGERSGKWGVWVVGLDGSGRLKVAEQACWVSWCSDGQLAFSSERDGNPEIYIARADGSGVTRVTDNPAKDRHPAWSPKGDRIAFSSTREGRAHIYVMAPDGSDVVRITNTDSDDENPSWSPDGKRIAFHRVRDGKRRVRTIGTDGKGDSPVATLGADASFPSFVSTGRVLFTSLSTGGKGGLVAADAVASMSASRPAPVGEFGAWFGRWSPDGTKVAYITGASPRSQIWVMSSNGSDKRELVGDPEGPASATSR